MRFLLDGCDISFIAEAPDNMTIKQLVEQADRIIPDWCACGVHSIKSNTIPTEIYFDYYDVWKSDDDVPCTILPKKKRYRMSNT